MALIKINLEQAVLSESAKAPTYRAGKVSGSLKLIVDSAHKAVVRTCLSNASKAKKLAVSALQNRIAANTMAVKKDPKQAGKVKTLKAKAAADAKMAKQLLRDGAVAMRKAGLSGLSSPLKASAISLTTEPGRSLRAVKAAQVDSLIVKGHKGYSKPTYAKLTAGGGAVKGTKAEKKKSPKAAASHEKAKKEQADVNKTNVKNLKNIFGSDFKKADLKRMQYTPTKDGGMTFLDQRGKKVKITSAQAEKHGIDLEELDGMLEDMNVTHNPRIA